MFKIGSCDFKNEVISSMQKELLNSKLEKKYGFDKIIKAANLINEAAELLDNTEFSAESNVLINILEKIANSDKKKV